VDGCAVHAFNRRVHDESTVTNHRVDGAAVIVSRTLRHSRPPYPKRIPQQ